VSGTGLTVRLCTASGEAGAVMPLIDLSRGGAALLGVVTLPPGTPVTLDMPGVAQPVPARIARVAEGRTAVAFLQDAATLRILDQVLESIGTPARAA
jgi:hypothetical protein